MLVYPLAELTIREIEFMLLLVGREISTRDSSDDRDGRETERPSAVGTIVRNVFYSGVCWNVLFSHD